LICIITNSLILIIIFSINLTLNIKQYYYRIFGNLSYKLILKHFRIKFYWICFDSVIIIVLLLSLIKIGILSIINISPATAVSTVTNP